MLDFMKNQTTHTSNFLKSYNYEKLDNRLINEKKALQTTLQEIFALGETDYYSEIFIRMNKNSEIKKIQKRIQEIENLNKQKDVLGREARINTLVKMAESMNPQFSLTKTAKLAFLTEIQVYTRNLENSFSLAIHKNMWKVYQLSRISGYYDFFLEILQKRCKKILINNKKFTKSCQSVETVIGYADIDVYFYAGNMAEVVNTVIHIFEVEYSSIEIDIKFHLLYKAVVAWVSSTKNSFFASEKALKVLNFAVFNKDCYEVSNICEEKIDIKGLLQ